MPTTPRSTDTRVRRRRAALLAAFVVLAAAAGAAALLRDAPETPAAAPAVTTPSFTPPVADDSPPAATAPRRLASTPQPVPSEPMLVGFMDDVSFRWSPSRAQLLDRAQATGARLIRAFVQWHLAAPERPRPGALPFDEPRMYELDELVANARARNMEVLFTIWGTPSWANGGLEPNHAPTDVDTLRDFARGLAARYPSVRRYSIWNEPNTQRFLTPQFDPAGRSVSPGTYAALFRAAREGIKEANPQALVAIGGTSSHGRDAPSATGMQDRHSPARFAQLLSQESPDLEFDAWAHNPYPVHPSVPPDGEAHWPAVTLPSLGRFANALDTWFGRDGIPIWITEFGYETSPAEPEGVAEDVHAAYAARAIELAAAVPQVTVFVWFAFADDESNAWQSGLLDETGAERPAYESFAAAVGEFAERR